MRAERPTQLRARATVLVGVALLGLALLPLLEPAGTPPQLVPWLTPAFLLAAVGQLLLARRVRTLRVVAGTLSSRQHLEFVEVPGAGHLDADEQAASQVVAWLNDRAAGRDAPDTCPEEPSPRWDVEPPRERAVPVRGRPELLPGPRHPRDRTGA
ncbi:MAG: hypothetical protein ACLFS9_03845 [Nitriliruptoraceae bacterium]